MRPFGVEDLSRQVALGQVALDPAGELAVYTRRTVVDGRDRIDLWTVPVAGGVPRALTDGPAWDTQPRFSPDGRLIAFLSARGDDPGQLHVIAREGGDARPLAAFPHGASDVIERIDRRGVAGSLVPCRFGETAAEPLVDPAALPLAGALAAAGGSVVATLTLGAGASAPELYALEPGGPRRLTGHGGAWLEGFSLPAVEVVEIGPIRTVLVHPPGAGDAPLATVLCIHGGPTDQWAVVPPLEAILLAGAGYRVALPNIRGSTDHGAAWIAALGGAWGDVDAADCHAVLDHLVDAGVADPARLGCSGLSYGGFVVNWLVGTSDRFAAAVSENGVANQVAAWANSDHGPTYNRAAELGDASTPAGVAALWRGSPLRHVARITTPLLMLQAADDLRCPPSDTEQLFTALRWLGREVAYVRYPGEHHTFHGSGRFDRRTDRHRRELDWFARHMPA